MNKEQFLYQLSLLIRSLPDNERTTILSFYREIIEDKVESGMTEAQAIAELGDINVLAQKILMENPNRKPNNTWKWVVGGICSVFVLLVIFAVISFNWFATKANHLIGEVSVQMNSKNVNINNENKTYTAKISDINQIELKADNKSIEVKPTDKDTVSIHYVKNENQKYEFSCKDGVLKMENIDLSTHTLNFDSLFHKGKWTDDDVFIVVELPKQYAKDIQIKTSNSKIDINDLPNLGNVTCETSNAAIELSDIKVKNIEIESANAALTLKEVVSAGKIEATTENAMINLKKISAPDIDLKTDNAIISGTIAGNESDYTITSHTTNGINKLNNRTGGSKKLNAQTTNGIISVSFE